jgi:NAD+ kinase
MKSKLKILLLYKNSTYAGYFLTTQGRFSQLKELFSSKQMKRFRKTHEAHFEALTFVENVLKKEGLKYTKACRGTSINYSKYNFIITLGGDGTFLEAAHHTRNQMIWGVNSDPQWSVGRFCSGNPNNFKSILQKILKGNLKTKTFHRLNLTFNNAMAPVYFLNDVLICHQSAGAMSRYYLKLGSIKEEQRSSGIWVSTAAGSSGAIFSAGGKVLLDESSSFEYRPRELYRRKGTSYKLKGAVLNPNQVLSVTSLMREGIIFVDGSHISLPFQFGTTVKIKQSSNPLKAIWS